MISNKPELIKIGETYIKFDFEYSESSKNLIKGAYQSQISHLFKELFAYKEFFKISIEYDKGSLKTKIIIWGIVMNLYLGIGNYGSFRAGIREIIKDMRSFSSFVIDRFENDPNIDPNSIIRTEKRTSLPGRIQDVYNRINRLERKIDNLTNNQIQVELNSIKQEIANLLFLLSDEIRQDFLSELPNNFTENLPAPDERRTQYLINRYGIKPDDEIEFIDE